MPSGLGRKNDEPHPEPDSDESAPGWDALTARLESAYPGQEPHHWKPNDVLLPGQDGVWGISGYRDQGGWFYVTFGLSDLFGTFAEPESESGGVVVSGFGFELTLRARSSEPAPPMWPVRLLDALGKHVYRTGGGLGPGHRMDASGPITGGDPGTRLTALAFWPDPVLDPIDSPYGQVDFLTVVGVTADELARMKASTTEAVIGELRERTASLVTDLAR